VSVHEIARASMPAVSAAESAEMAGLRYVSDRAPGIKRRRAGRGFTYLDVEGAPIRERRALRRIKALVIPPAWNDVWICPLSNGHIQASARDAKGRKQYRYHTRWREIRDESKFDRMTAFGEALPALRSRVDRDLAQSGLPRSKLLATVVRLLELTLIRIGNEEYVRANESYGLTTLREKHVKVSGSTLRFRFRGKSGKLHEVEVSDRRLAAIVKRCQAIPGHELFQYIDDEGQQQSIDSSEVNAYLRECTGQDFTAKDFRTWGGTLLAAQALRSSERGNGEPEAKRCVVEAIKRVAKRLGNTPATCRKHYVHPIVIEAFMSGRLGSLDASSPGIASEETALLTLLRQGVGLDPMATPPPDA
jgi:DNA topoisomerase-1